MPNPPTIDRRLAKDVATLLDRRRLRRKLLLIAALAGAIIVAILYGTCGGGWGLGKGAGSGGGPRGVVAPIAADAGPRRCAIRVAAAGITVDGKPMSQAQAVVACKPTTGADVVVTGDARQGDWDALRAALIAAGIEVNTRQGSAAP